MQISESTTVADAAKLYAQIGLTPIPVHGILYGKCTCGDSKCTKPGKHPVGRGWQRSAPKNIEEVIDVFRTHRGNIGIYCGNKYVLIDADGDAGIANLSLLGNLPPTLSAISGSGNGRHFLYKLQDWHDPSSITDRSSAIAPGIDIKIRGQFVVAPSVHISGRRYQWISLVEPAPLPDWLYERLRKPVIAAPAHRPLAGSRDTSNIYRRVQRYISAIPGAVSGEGGHAATFAVARKIVNNGLSEAEEAQLMAEYNERCIPPWSEAELAHKLESARRDGRHTGLPDRQASPVQPPGPRPPSTPPDPPQHPEDSWRALLIWKESKNRRRLARVIDNAVIILQFDPRWAGKIRLDTFKRQVVVRDAPWLEHQRGRVESNVWTEEDTARLYSWLVREEDLDLSIDALHRAVVLAAEHAAYSSAADWFNGLVWDRVYRLDHWLCTYLGAPDTEYTHNVGRWWLISAVARALRPGCKADHVLILEGPQGAKKSSALRVLAGADWFTDTPIDLSSKDAFMAMDGKLIVEMSELDSLRKADADRAKAFFTSSVDYYRPPYARQMVSRPRSCVFAGTVNHSEYLRDETGNRRYWPVACGQISLEALARDREQLWAEAVWAYRGNAPWYPSTPDEHAALAAEQDERLQHDSWEDVVSEWARENSITETTVAKVLEAALKIPTGHWGRAEQLRAAAVLRRLGFVASGKTRRFCGSPARVFVKTTVSGGVNF